MKKGTLLNDTLSWVVASQGHTDTLCIGDAGLPIPESTLRIDLAVSPGIPSFLEVFDAVTSELMYEKIVLADEIKDKNPTLWRAILDRVPPEAEVEYVTHDVLKEKTAVCTAVVRTGEFTPFANVIFVSGVAF
jgi:D-ribose pyranase